MSKQTKKDLIQALKSMTDHRDILVDKLEGTRYTIKDLEEEVSELEGKAETLDELESMTEEKDILFDKLETANNEINDLEDEIKELQGKAETLDILIDLLDCYHIANQRYLMGVTSELETIEKLTEKLLDLRSIN